jgi:hypothetical protein
MSLVAVRNFLMKLIVDNHLFMKNNRTSTLICLFICENALALDNPKILHF